MNHSVKGHELVNQVQNCNNRLDEEGEGQKVNPLPASPLFLKSLEGYE